MELLFSGPLTTPHWRWLIVAFDSLSYLGSCQTTSFKNLQPTTAYYFYSVRIQTLCFAFIRSQPFFIKTNKTSPLVNIHSIYYFNPGEGRKTKQHILNNRNKEPLPWNYNWTLNLKEKFLQESNKINFFKRKLISIVFSFSLFILDLSKKVSGTI